MVSRLGHPGLKRAIEIVGNSIIMNLQIVSKYVIYTAHLLHNSKANHLVIQQWNIIKKRS